MVLSVSVVAANAGDVVGVVISIIVLKEKKITDAVANVAAWCVILFISDDDLSPSLSLLSDFGSTGNGVFALRLLRRWSRDNCSSDDDDDDVNVLVVIGGDILGWNDKQTLGSKHNNNNTAAKNAIVSVVAARPFLIIFSRLFIPVV